MTGDLTTTLTVLDPHAVSAQLDDHDERISEDGREIDELRKRVAVLEDAIAALNTSPRPVPDGHIRFEDLGVDSIREALTRAEGLGDKVLNLPEGVFEFADFQAVSGQPYVAGLTIPTTCQGIVGQGIGKTILRMTPRTSTKAGSVPAQAKAPATNPLYLIQAAFGIGRIFEGFTLEGTEQGHLYGGLALAQTVNPVVRDILVTGIPGDRNSPPGETFAINVWRGSGMVGERIEVDGRRDGVRVGGSPFGYNTTSGSTLTDCYFHDCLASTLTYWETTDSDTVRVRIERNGTGSTAGMQYAHGINHERSGNIDHIDPTIVIDQQVNPTGYHMTFNSDVTPVGGLAVRNPTVSVDKRVPDGRIVIMTFKTYRGVTNTLLGTLPVVLDSAGNKKAYARAT